MIKNGIHKINALQVFAENKELFKQNCVHEKKEKKRGKKHMNLLNQHVNEHHKEQALNKQIIYRQQNIISFLSQMRKVVKSTLFIYFSQVVTTQITLTHK